MHNFFKRIEHLESASGTLVTAVYSFQPKKKTVYRKNGDEKIYMDWDQVMAAEYTVAETIVALPNYANDNWEEELDGLWKVCLQGESVINENNQGK